MSLSRTGCCDTWPKPCPYHEGVADALAQVDPEGRTCESCGDEAALVLPSDGSAWCAACHGSAIRLGYESVYEAES